MKRCHLLGRVHAIFNLLFVDMVTNFFCMYMDVMTYLSEYKSGKGKCSSVCFLAQDEYQDTCQKKKKLHFFTYQLVNDSF